MAKRTITMRQIIEILRLKNEHQLSVREIARSCGLAPSTVGDYLNRLEGAQIPWPLPEGLSEAEVERPRGRDHRDQVLLELLDRVGRVGPEGRQRALDAVPASPADTLDAIHDADSRARAAALPAGVA